MEQYIPKSALVAEIERLRKNQRLDDRHGQGVLDGLYAIKRFLDTIEVKEVDLEEEICTFFSKNPIPYEHITDWPLLKNCAIHFFELGMSVNNKAQEGK